VVYVLVRCALVPHRLRTCGYVLRSPVACVRFVRLFTIYRCVWLRFFTFVYFTFGCLFAVLVRSGWFCVGLFWV